jgi:hypothetical protein
VSERLSIAEYFMAVLDDELHCVVLGVHIGHFAFKASISHNSRSKDDGEILRCHLRSISI